jgi:hypothetical protein
MRPSGSPSLRPAAPIEPRPLTIGTLVQSHKPGMAGRWALPPSTAACTFVCHILLCCNYLRHLV